MVYDLKAAFPEGAESLALKDHPDSSFNFKFHSVVEIHNEIGSLFLFSSTSLSDTFESYSRPSITLATVVLEGSASPSLTVIEQ